MTTGAHLGLLLGFAAACGCGASSHPEVRSAGEASAKKDANPTARLLPLTDGTQLAYDVVDDETGHTGMFVTRIHRVGPARVELTTGNTTKVLELVADGVVRDDGTYLLKAPLAIDARWPGPGGGRVHITAVDRTVQVPAGLFVGCLETVEDRGGEQRRRTTTVFCPDVGIASMEVEAWAGVDHALERATLRSFGAPVQLGGAPQ